MRLLISMLLLALVLFSQDVVGKDSIGIINNPARTFPRLPLGYRQVQFEKVEKGFNHRAEKFLSQEKYQKWVVDKPEEEILKEFEVLDKWRESLWYKDPAANVLESQEDFMISQALLINHRYRKPHLIAFSYNVTDDSYNSSTIVLNGHKFLSMEAPSKDTTESFFNLLQNFHVTHLVRLTPSMEEGNFKSHPYWRGKEELDPETQDAFLNIPLESEEDMPDPYKVRYIWIDSWKDHHVTSVTDLLRLILEARKGYTSSSLIAVHCHSGVSRTGTFIAGFILLDEIDKQIASGKKPQELDISIEKTVKQLSLQRFYMVGKPKQYLMLYRLVDHYVKSLKR